MGEYKQQLYLGTVWEWKTQASWVPGLAPHQLLAFLDTTLIVGWFF